MSVVFFVHDSENTWGDSLDGSLSPDIVIGLKGVELKSEMTKTLTNFVSAHTNEKFLIYFRLHLVYLRLHSQPAHR
jgi:hypothetical protein